MQKVIRIKLEYEEHDRLVARFSQAYANNYLDTAIADYHIFYQWVIMSIVAGYSDPKTGIGIDDDLYNSVFDVVSEYVDHLDGMDYSDAYSRAHTNIFNRILSALNDMFELTEYIDVYQTIEALLEDHQVDEVYVSSVDLELAIIRLEYPI